MGTLVDELRATEPVLERDLNGAGDNPLLMDGEWLEGGNFHGAPVAQALDSLKTVKATRAAQRRDAKARLAQRMRKHARVMDASAADGWTVDALGECIASSIPS